MSTNQIHRLCLQLKWCMDVKERVSIFDVWALLSPEEQFTVILITLDVSWRLLCNMKFHELHSNFLVLYVLPHVLVLYYFDVFIFLIWNILMELWWDECLTIVAKKYSLKILLEMIMGESSKSSNLKWLGGWMVSYFVF